MSVKTVKKGFCCVLALLITLFSVSCSHPTDDQSTSHVYGDILDHLANAFPWDGSQLNLVPEQPEMSYLYRHHSDPADIVYAFADIDGNGQPELLLSGKDSSVIYDMYTVVKGQPMHIFSSHERSGYQLYSDGYIQHTWSASTYINGIDFYRFQDGELVFLQRITVDAAYAQKVGIITDIADAADACYFQSNSTSESEYRQITAEEAASLTDQWQRKEVMQLDWLSLPF